MHPSLLCSWPSSNTVFVYFTAQSIVDRAIGDICILFQCSRYNLNVVSTLILSPSIFLLKSYYKLRLKM